jgi:predicted hydrolase (HD superfamily)
VYPNLTEEQFKEKVFALVLERDLRVYQNYGIKMEDFIYGILLYEN